MSKKIIQTITLLLSLFLFGCGLIPETEKDKSDAAAQDAAEKKSSEKEMYQIPDDLEVTKIEIEVENYGIIKAELDPEYAPITVNNFLTLTKEGFYDGLTFHRIISGFMIQGGDPDGNGSGGSGQNIKGEFSSNGVENPASHTRGALSMARSTAPDSASSQFFIVHQDSLHLDGDYAVFGYVTEGIEIVDQICEDTKVQGSNGAVASEDQPVIKTIKIVE